jgi:Flp pilus assembly protein TadD
MQRFASGIIAALLLLGSCSQHGGAPARAAMGDASPQTLNVADAAIAGGDPGMALSVSQSVLASDPNNPDALVHEGDAFYALGRCPSAEAVYRKAIAQGAKAAAQIGLGRCLLKTDPAAAEAAFAQAVVQDPTDAAALDDLGIARDLQGNFAGAVAPYRRALQADPGDVAAEVNLGLSLALSGNGPAALQYLGPLAVGQSATPKIREDYAAALVADGRDRAARQVLGIDLPPDQVVSAMSGFAAVIAQAQAPVGPVTPLPSDAARAAAVRTVPTVPTVARNPASPAVQPAAAPPARPASRPIVLATALAPAPAPSLEAAPAAKVATGAPAAMQPAAAIGHPPAALPVAAVSRPAVRATPLAAAPAPHAAQPPAAVAPGRATGSAVQLAALNSPIAAERAWRHLQDRAPALFKGRVPAIEPAQVHDRTFYRLRVGGFADKAAAARFCGEVLAAGSPCTPADF